jgi:DNA repair protein RadC
MMAMSQLMSADGCNKIKRDAATVRRALRIIEQQLCEYGVQFTDPSVVKDFLRLRLALEKREVFICLFLTPQNRLIEAREMFTGTLTQTAVYPREIARAALELNAATVILAHNHPSGSLKPSVADQILTITISQSLALLDVLVIDHLIVAGDAVLSFAEAGFHDGLRVTASIQNSNVQPIKRKIKAS